MQEAKDAGVRFLWIGYGQRWPHHLDFDPVDLFALQDSIVALNSDDYREWTVNGLVKHVNKLVVLAAATNSMFVMDTFGPDESFLDDPGLCGKQAIIRDNAIQILDMQGDFDAILRERIESTTCLLDNLCGLIRRAKPAIRF